MAVINWKTGTSGTFTTAADWSTGTVPGSTDTVIISAAPISGSYIVWLESSVSIGSLVLDQAAATLEVTYEEQLTIGTGLDLEAGTIYLDDGTLTVGTITSAAGTLLSGFTASLSALSVQGDLLLESSSANDTFFFAGNLALLPGASSAATTITADSTSLDFTATQTTLGGGTILLDNAALNNFGAASGGFATLTLASNLVLDVTGASTLTSGSYSSDYAGSSFVNNGVISITGSNAELLGTDYGTFTNAGSISVADGATLNFQLTTNPDFATQQPDVDFTNTGIITVAAGGVFAVQLDSTFINTGKITGAGTLSLAGSFTTGAALSIGLATTGALQIDGTLLNTGTTLKAGHDGTVKTLLLGDGTVTGGTIVNQGGFEGIGGPPLYNPFGGGGGGTLSGVTFDGPLTVSNNSTVVIANATVLHGLNGKGGGTIALGSVASSIEFSGSQSLSGASITGATATTYTNTGAGIFLIDPTYGTPTVLTLTGTTSITGSLFGFTGADYNGLPSGDTILNTGTLSIGGGGIDQVAGLVLRNTGSLDITSTTISLSASNLINNGTLAISGASTSVSLQTSSLQRDFINTKLITIGAGATLQIGGGGYYDPVDLVYTNTGTIAVNGGTLLLDTGLATAALGTIQISNGGLLNIEGTLTNTGKTLKLGTGTALANVDITGLITGGTFAAASTGAFIGAAGSYGTPDYAALFSGVTILGPLLLNQTTEDLTIENGFALKNTSGSGAGSIVITGAGAELDIDTETLSNIDITIGASGYAAALGASVSDTLTLAKTTAVQQTGLLADLNNTYQSTMVNDGVITNAVAGGVLSLGSTFTNAGTLDISNGATLALDQTTLTNSGTISIDNGFVNLSDEDISVLSSLSLTNTTLQIASITATGETLSVGAGSSIPLAQISGAFTGGTIHDAGGGVQFLGENINLQGVTYQGLMSITNPYTKLVISEGLTVKNLNGTSPGTIALTGAGSALIIDPTPLNNATIDIGNTTNSYDGTAVAAPEITGESTLTLGSAITLNQVGTYAAIGGQAATVSAATVNAAYTHGNFVLQGSNFTNTGTIAISNTDTVTAAAINLLNAGTVSIAGTASTLNLDTAAYFQSGTYAPNSFENAGKITLTGGTLAELTAGGAFPELPMQNAGTIAGNGTLAVAIVNTGTIAATAGTLTLTQQITGAGLLESKNATLLLTGGVSQGVIAQFSGAHAVLGLAPPSFLGKIAGFATGDTLDLLHEAATAASFSGDSIIVTLTAGGTLTLETTTALTGALEVRSDTQGNALISFAPAPTIHSDPIPLQGG
jgi:hypothetical protein